jgi:hypothetical protein
LLRLARGQRATTKGMWPMLCFNLGFQRKNEKTEKKKEETLFFLIHS